ncbi:MAG: SiaB family protein kinase [Microscillaceae bacterium]|nr:SiaB family protein kinase [Microscillaceae bacterium]
MKLDVSLIKSVLSIYDELLSNGISLVYLGVFNHDITKMFTSMAEEDMDRNSEKVTTKRRVYHVMVETLQNMNKHSDEISEKGNIGRGLFMIGKKNECYYIITSNKVSGEKKEQLESALELINNASKEQLKDMYRKQIKFGNLSEKGGAGLGLIDIARKTTGRHDYQFIPFDDGMYFFILKVEIDTDDIKMKGNEKYDDDEGLSEE